MQQCFLLLLDESTQAIYYFEKPENKKLYNLFKNVEMPCVKIVASMELTGVEIDLEYCQRLQLKYHKQLDTMKANIDRELSSYAEQIRQWRLTPEANLKLPKERGSGFQKSKSEQLEDPVNISSPSQLAILLYDVLKLPVVDKKKPRGTGKDELTKLYNTAGVNLCNMILEYKKLSKLIESFLDTLPKQVNPNTHRVHCNYNQIGADTGRFSCSEPNLQQIPSRNKEIRMMFRANTFDVVDKDIEGNAVLVFNEDEVLTTSGYIEANKLKIGDTLVIEEDSVSSVTDEIVQIEFIDSHVKIILKGE